VSDFDDLFALGIEVLQDLDALTVTRHPAGNMAVAERISVPNCLWIEIGSRRDDSQGQNNVRTGRLEVPTSVTVLPNDAWTVSGELWLTKSHGPVEAGLRTVILELVDEVNRRPTAVWPRQR
jgi:hypothetical protein